MDTPRRQNSAPAPSYDAVLHRYLAEHDAPCPGCGYNLRGLVGDACPECHQPVCISVVLPGVGGVAGAGDLRAEWFRVTRAWLMVLLTVGVALAALHLLAGLAGGSRWGFTRARLVRKGGMTLLSLSVVIVLMLWERWGRTAHEIDPGTGQSRGWAAIAAAAGIVVVSGVLLVR